ncbi:hypothetical protein BaRGS_00006869, partial [Batillaria attramentaria]
MPFTEENRRELEDNGYTVVENVLTDTECRQIIGQFKDWLSTNFAEGEFPHTAHSLVQRYRVGHLDPAWRVRLKSRDVFAELWGTNRLLTSVDAVAIGRPPEDGEEMFAHPDCPNGWLHLDQSPRRQGLHAYQGAVYLEQADEDDWTFEVLEGSHRFFDEYYNSNPVAKTRALARGHMKTRDEHLDWLRLQGCVQKRVPAPRGGMLLWRWVVLTCMAPACWATEKALLTKRTAYNKLLMTTHWPCDDIGLFPTELPSYGPRELRPLKRLPEVARSTDAKRLMGVVPYPKPSSGKEKEKEKELLAIKPKWHPLYQPDLDDQKKGICSYKCACITILVCVFAVLLAASLFMLAVLSMV